MVLNMSAILEKETDAGETECDARDIKVGASSRPLRVVVVGAGNRGHIYASYALLRPDRLQVVAVADPVAERARALGDRFGVKAENLFESYQAVAARPQMADAAINCTMDQMHLPSSLALLDAGYHILLEKPIASSETEIRQIMDAAKRNRRKVMVGHVLRYAPFYQKIKQLLAAGTIGKIIALHSSENVAYAPYVTSFVRGPWNRSELTMPMILAKCCHDLDLIAWYLESTRPVRVGSFGGLTYFTEKNAPEGSAARCLDGCKIEASCPYSARKLYAEREFIWPASKWGDEFQYDHFPDYETRLKILATTSPFGRCVWHCDNNVVDHQNVIAEFADGTTATHNMWCNTARPTRVMHLIGTDGEIEGDLTSQTIKIHRMSPRDKLIWTTEELDVSVKESGAVPVGAVHITHGHGGGDGRLIEDFVSVALNEHGSDASTLLEHSLAGHQIGFAADLSMREHRMVDI
jgi:predicted dehydrogenase